MQSFIFRSLPVSDLLLALFNIGLIRYSYMFWTSNLDFMITFFITKMYRSIDVAVLIYLMGST